jgi:hypothetical protein
MIEVVIWQGYKDFALELRSIIFHIIGFGVINIVGVDSSKARIGDIVVEIIRNGFDIKAQVWMKVYDGNRAWRSIVQF